MSLRLASTSLVGNADLRNQYSRSVQVLVVGGGGGGGTSGTQIGRAHV